MACELLVGAKNRLGQAQVPTLQPPQNGTFVFKCWAMCLIFGCIWLWGRLLGRPTSRPGSFDPRRPCSLFIIVGHVVVGPPMAFNPQYI